MATFSNPTLAITPSSDERYVNVVATVVVATTPNENQLITIGVRFRLACQLRGNDGKDDDVLFVFPRQLLTAGTKIYTFSGQVLREVLNEDPGPDEIEARFKIRVAQLPNPVNSPTVVLKD